MQFAKYTVLAGNYGSGKTEISLNLAVRAAKEGKRTMLVDLDIVNPFFRSSEHEEYLKSLGILVVKPNFANTTVDVPSLPAEIYSAFDLPLDAVIFDVGGDPVGASALGILQDKFRQNMEQTEFLYVVNGARPLQETPEAVLEMMRQIERNSRLRVSAFINNTNLARQTDLATIRQGEELVAALCAQTGLPKKCTAVLEELAEKAEVEGEILPLHLYMRPAWLDENGQ